MTTEYTSGLLVRGRGAFVYVIFLFVTAMGLVALYAGIDILWTGRESVLAGLVASAAGAIIALVGLGFFYIRIFRSRVWAARDARLRNLYPEQPWMMRDDWRARRMVHSNARTMLFMWIWTAGWWSAIALIGRLNYDKIVDEVQRSWGTAILIIVLIVFGLLGLYMAIKLTRAHLRFGVSYLAIDTLPGYLGDRFRGTVSAGLEKLPLEPLDAELVCQLLTERRRRVSGKTETSIERTDIWKTRTPIVPGKLLQAGNRVQIPVSIDLPPDQPETDMKAGLGICWTLHVSTTGSQDPRFSCAFEVPIFERR